MIPLFDDMLKDILSENFGLPLTPLAWQQVKLSYSDIGFGFGCLEDIPHAAFAAGAITALPTILGQFDFSPTVIDILNDEISNKSSILPYLNDINRGIIHSQPSGALECVFLNNEQFHAGGEQPAHYHGGPKGCSEGKSHGVEAQKVLEWKA